VHYLGVKRVTKRSSFLSQSIDSDGFQPTLLLQNRHLQTLFATYFRRQTPPKILREKFYFDDGDFVETVWRDERPTDNRPIVILFHGLAGSLASPYILGLMNALYAQGYAAVLMHFRGCGEEENLLPRAYHSGDTEDARDFISYLRQLYSASSLHAVGFSIGGNVLLKLLGEWGSASPLLSAVSISAPLRLDVAADTIERGFARVYQSYLLNPLKQTLLDKYQRFDMQTLLEIDEKRVKNIKTIREFDELYTAKIHGFESSRDYYTQCSSRQYLKDIATPTLIIYALDDPFMTPEILPKRDEVSDFVSFDISQHGGHVGFVGGSFWEPHYWLDERILKFFNTSSPL
jgi:predicted alpha/beta-fold hydrolase